jgi:deoxyxylulose-5-phosphate synthase
MTKSVEELEREFAREVRRFIDMAIAEGHSLQEAKAMARDVVARIAITLIRSSPSSRSVGRMRL